MTPHRRFPLIDRGRTRARVRPPLGPGVAPVARPAHAALASAPSGSRR